MLNKIISFRPKTENTVNNFYMSNGLVTAWAFDKLGQHDKSMEWLAEQDRAYPANKILAWCRSVFEGKPVAPLTETEKDANMLILEKIK
jgi:hypothetical protein